MKLVENWKHFYKWYSTHLIILLAALPEVWAWLPMEWKAALPDGTLKWLCIVVGGLALSARVLSQSKKAYTDDPKPDKDV